MAVATATESPLVAKWDTIWEDETGHFCFSSATLTTKESRASKLIYIKERKESQAW